MAAYHEAISAGVQGDAKQAPEFSGALACCSMTQTMGESPGARCDTIHHPPAAEPCIFLWNRAPEVT